MSGKNLSYEIFKGVNLVGRRGGGGGGGALFFFFFYEIGLEVASGFRFDLPWIRTDSFPLAYLSQPAGL